jgi:hypothetical protein
MRFVAMHKADPSTEAELPPTPELMTGMGTLTHDMQQAGVFLAAEGLRSSRHRVRLQVTGGQLKVTQGPLTGSNELIAGFAMLRVQSMDEAVAWTKRYAEVVGDAELEIGPLGEPWDIGLCEKPPGDVPLRVLVLHKADARAEAGVPPTAEEMAKMRAFTEEITKAGVLVSSEGFRPSAQGTRLHYTKGKRKIIDGPFTESKELIAGFCMMQVKSKAEALEWISRFANAYGDVEIDLLQLY